jgi:Mg2+ and Co2+ transporter CorA
MARRLLDFVRPLASRIAALERQIMKGHLGDPEQVLEEMFRVRHELLTVRTMAAENREMYARMATLAPRFMPPEVHPFITDLLDQFDRVRSLCDLEKEFLQGVVDFYQSRTTTKMNIAMERLALLATLGLPITVVASIYGMNIPVVHDDAALVHLAAVLAVTGMITLVMLHWAKRQGWW